MNYVYVVTSGMYDGYQVDAVYGTVTTAMNAYPAGRWVKINEDEWDNGLQLDNNRTIIRFEVRE